MKGRTVLAGILFLAVLGGMAFPAAGQDAAPPEATAAEPVPPADSTLAEIEALKQQIEVLAEKVRMLEEQQQKQQQAQAAAPEPAPAAKPESTPIVTAGKDGFGLQSPDKAFQLKIGGMIGYDWAWFDQDRELMESIGDDQDGTGFNFARIRLAGTVYDIIEYAAEYDFATQTGADGPEFKDVYIQLNGIPYGGGRTASFRAGHFREPFSLEELTSTRFRTFMERGLLNALVPGRNPGVQISDALWGEEKSERFTYALGVFKNADNWPSSNDSDEDQGYIFTGRVTALPFYRDAGRELVHVGLAYSRRNPDGAVLGWAARPESRLSLVRYVDTERFPLYRLRDARADDVDLLGLELAGVYGPFSLQGEYVLADVDTTFDGNRSFDGYYAQASYFLTGEHRPYRNSLGIFDRVKPKRNFGWKADDGLGAWEIAARYSTIDLSDGAVRGGEQDDITLGLNWYLNPNTRVMWNYIHGDVDHELYGGDFDTLQMRFQVDF
jgi:phosphate-selective porin OprO/OprP